MPPMSRQTNKLSAVAVRNARPAASQRKLADGGGLYLEINTGGSRIWRLKYRFAGREKKLTIGAYPTVSLAEARDARDSAKKLLVDGIDPGGHKRLSQERLRETSRNTFRAVAEEWLEEVHSKNVVPAHFTRNRRRLELHAFPSLGKRPVAEIDPPEVLDCLRRIERCNRRETAHRVKTLCSQVFRYGISTGRCQRDPTTDLRGALPAHNSKHHAAIIDPAEIPDLLDAIDSYGGHPTTRAALQLAVLVFTRPGELRQARWRDIDLAAATWSFTASKTGLPFIVPLPAQAVDILKEVQALTGRSEYVFPSIRSNRRPMSDATLSAALTTLGYRERMTAHGFRAMARTMLREQLKYHAEYIECQLAHAVRDANGRAYDRTTHLLERREMLQTWADYLDGIREAHKDVKATSGNAYEAYVLVAHALRPDVVPDPRLAEEEAKEAETA